MSSPLQDFKLENPERWSVLYDVPLWEQETIINWLHNVLVSEADSYMTRREVYSYQIVRYVETQNRLLLSELGINRGTWAEMVRSLEELIRQHKYMPFLRFLEGVVKFVRDHPENVVPFGENILHSTIVLTILEDSLDRGSKWRIVGEKYADAGLVERVDERLTAVAKDLNVDYLTKAWNQAFMVNPDPAKAIEDAQRAIEHVASESGLTNAKTSVYGNLLGDIKANPDIYISAAKAAYDLNNVLSRDPKNPVDYNEQFAKWFWTGLNLIQKTNPGHHASKVTKGFSLSPEAGQQAVLIATLLCQLMKSGFFAKKSKNQTATEGQTL